MFDIFKNACDIIKNECDIKKTVCDIMKIVCDIIKIVFDIIKTVCNLIKAVCNIIKTVYDIMETKPIMIKYMNSLLHCLSIWLASHKGLSQLSLNITCQSPPNSHKRPLEN